MYILACLTSFAFLGWVTFSKFGDITFGKRGEKPVYSNFFPRNRLMLPGWRWLLTTESRRRCSLSLKTINPMADLDFDFHIQRLSRPGQRD